MKVRVFRWWRRTQADIRLGRFGYLCIGWTWREDGRRPVLYWSPDATPSNSCAIGLWRKYGV